MINDCTTLKKCTRANQDNKEMQSQGQGIILFTNVYLVKLISVLALRHVFKNKILYTLDGVTEVHYVQLNSLVLLPDHSPFTRGMHGSLLHKQKLQF